MAGIKMGRWGWAGVAAGSVALIFVVLWGFSTDWNFTTSKVLEAAKNPKEGDACTTADNKTGTIKNGACAA